MYAAYPTVVVTIARGVVPLHEHGCDEQTLGPVHLAFASGNWDLLLSTAAIYATPRWLPAVLFAGVIAWEVLAAVSF